MKEVLALVLSFSMITGPVFAQDNSAAPAEEADESAPAEDTEAVQPEKTETESAAPEAKAEESSKDAPAPEKKAFDETGAPPKGTSKWVPGIVITSVGTVLGIAFLAYSRIDCKDAYKDDVDEDTSKQKNRDDNIRNCEKFQPTFQKAGAVFLLGGVGVGVPLIYFGLKERGVYKDWRAAKEAEQASNTRRHAGHADLVLLPNSQNSVSPGVSLTYSF